MYVFQVSRRRQRKLRVGAGQEIGKRVEKKLDVCAPLQRVSTPTDTLGFGSLHVLAGPDPSADGHYLIEGEAGGGKFLFGLQIRTVRRAMERDGVAPQCLEARISERITRWEPEADEKGSFPPKR